MKLKINKQTLLFPIVFSIIFYSVAVWRFLATGKVFYLWNFGYIGSALALGIFLTGALPKDQFRLVRRISQLLIGSYLLIYVGIIRKENLQIEGFWYYLFSGVFAGATLHYFIAKIFGPFIFNRGWCGWACWTAMILDLFPWKRPEKEINSKWTKVRYIYFLLILILTIVVYFFMGIQKDVYEKGSIELYWLLIGNIVYYIIGFFLALTLKDNRAFCKYVCPIPVFQKVGAKYSLLKIEINNDKCIECRKCELNCPMQIKLLDYKNKKQRLLSTECIFCNTCTSVCQENAIGPTFKIDKRINN